MSDSTEKEDLECSVCLKLFIDPVVLPCGHSFCLECVKALERTHFVRCPRCSSSLPPSGDLKVDITLKTLVEEEKREVSLVRCGQCEENDASFECLQCQFALCSTCKEGAHARGGFSSHKVVPLSTLCRKHQKELSLYSPCREELVCVSCVRLAEPGYFGSVFSVPEALAKGRAVCSKALETVRQKLQAKPPREADSDTATCIRETFRSLRAALDAREEELLHRVGASLPSTSSWEESLRDQLIQAERNLLQLEFAPNALLYLKRLAKVTGLVDRLCSATAPPPSWATVFRQSPCPFSAAKKIHRIHQLIKTLGEL